MTDTLCRYSPCHITPAKPRAPAICGATASLPIAGWQLRPAAPSVVPPGPRHLSTHKQTQDKICNLRDLVPIQKPCVVEFVEIITLLILSGQNSEATDALAS